MVTQVQKDRLFLRGLKCKTYRTFCSFFTFEHYRYVYTNNKFRRSFINILKDIFFKGRRLKNKRIRYFLLLKDNLMVSQDTKNQEELKKYMLLYRKIQRKKKGDSFREKRLRKRIRRRNRFLISSQENPGKWRRLTFISSKRRDKRRSKARIDLEICWL